MTEKPEALWARVLRTKYKCGPLAILTFQMRIGDSNLWQGVCGVWPEMQNGIRWIIRNGENIRFCLDAWITGCNALANYPNVIVLEREKMFSVAFSIKATGEWDWEKLECQLPNFFILKIRSMMSPNRELGQDRASWSLSMDGRFLVKSAYDLLSSNYNRQLDNVLRKNWRWKGLERVRMFLWILCKQRLLTNSIRRERHMALEDSCPRCGLYSESVMHMVRDCAKVSNLRMSAVKPSLW